MIFYENSAEEIKDMKQRTMAVGRNRAKVKQGKGVLQPVET